jgi:putative acetyltransferase
MPVRIRRERAADVDAIRAVNVAAFEKTAEADLVEALRIAAAPLVSLVADAGGDVIGHIMFSPVTVAGSAPPLMMGLAPMAVVPARQREGIGSALVREGLAACERLGAGAVVVLGHAAFYPRFGFTPASRFGLSCEYDVPDDVFMAMELDPGSLRGASGTIRYHRAFANV